MKTTGRTTPLPDWILVHRVRWYAWLPLTIYGSFVNLFIGLLGLGGLGFGIAALFGLAPKINLLPFNSSSALWSYAVHLFELACTLFLAWAGLSSTRTDLLDMFTPALTYEGRLDLIKIGTRLTKNSKYRVFELSAANGQWEVAFHDLSDRFKFERLLQPGRQVRLTYRRGSRLLTQVLVANPLHKKHTSGEKNPS